MKVVAIRYFIAKRNCMIDDESKDTLLDGVVQTKTVDGEKKLMVKMDMEQLFSLMPNRRYVYVIRRLVLQEAEPKVVAQELNTSVENLYNIKKRALSALTDIALKNSREI
jgi:hypothetical protein